MVLQIEGKVLGVEVVNKEYKGQKKQQCRIHLLQGYESIQISVPKEMIKEVVEKNEEMQEYENMTFEVKPNFYNEKLYLILAGKWW